MKVASAQGMDVSNFQGPFAWAKTKGLSFGTFRLTQGLGAGGDNSPDPQARWNHQQIAAKGLHRGVYHFLDPRESGEAQAGYFTGEAAKLGLEPADSLWLDNEAANGVSPGGVAACARAFMAELDKLVPHNPRGVYTFLDFARQGCCDGLGKYPLWIAHPSATAPAAPAPWDRWTFWQWGTRNGADADAFNGSAAGLTAWLKTFAAPGGEGRQVVKHTTGGALSLLALADGHATTPAAVLRHTAQMSPGHVFPGPVAAWVNAVFAGKINVSKPMPAGLELWMNW